MPSPRKMPPGKEQFGIIIPTNVHSKAKQLTGLLPGTKRISDVYAEGVNAIWDKYHASSSREKNKREVDIEETFAGLPDELVPYVKAVARLLKSNPDQSSIEMLTILIRKFLPEESKGGSVLLEKQA